MQQIISSSTMRMTSIEIADLVGSRHDSVKRTVERLAEGGVISLPPLVEVKIQRERLILVSGYSAVPAARLPNLSVRVMTK